MNKTLRDKLDIRIAFQAPIAPKGSIIADEPSAGKPHPIDQNIVKPPQMQEERMSTNLSLKAILRVLAKSVYTIFKPVLRPVAFRIKHYLVDEMRQDLLREVQGRSNAISHEIRAAAAANTLEIRNEFAAMIQQMQATFDASSRQNCMAFDTVIEELQGTSETTRQAEVEIKQIVMNSSSEAKNAAQHLEHLLLPQLGRIENYAIHTVRRVAINTGSNELLIRTEVGYMLCAADDHALISTLLEAGELEAGTRLLIQRFLRSGDTFVDVGANIGMHTLAAAHAMKGKGEIIAFEPFEETKNMLEKSVWMNGFSGITRIHRAAVSNRSGSQRLFIGGTSGHHSLFSLEASPIEEEKSVDVPLVTLDETIARNKPVTLLKIDAEGSETDVVEGAYSLIEGNPNIALIVEYGPSHLRRIGKTPEQWFSTFDQLGLESKVINTNSGNLESWTRLELDEVESVNLFFSRAGSEAWDRLS